MVNVFLDLSVSVTVHFKSHFFPFKIVQFPFPFPFPNSFRASLLTLPMPRMLMHTVSNTTSVSTFCHFSFTTTEGECTGSGSCSKVKWNLATSKIFTGDVHENTNFNLTVDLFWYPVFHFGCVPFVIKVNFDPLCTSVRLCIISHATPMFFGPWINLWLCVDAGGGGGMRVRDRSILQRWQFCFRGGDIQFSNKH